MKSIIIFTILILTSLLHGQTNPQLYDLLIKNADSLYKVKQYKNSGIMYSSAFEVLKGKGVIKDRCTAARSWALSNEPDSAFKNLDKIIRKRLFTEYDKLETEEDFINLHSDSRWKALIDTMNFHKSIKPTGTSLKSANFSIKNNSIKDISLFLIDANHNEIFYFDIKPKKTIP